MGTTDVTESLNTVIIGAGQAGLSISYELRQAGLEHVILERGRVAESWRGRWDNFCLVTPNWSVQLPGNPYRGDDPDGFMPKAEIIAHLAGYAQSFQAPVRENVNVLLLERDDRGSFVLRTTIGNIRAQQVVIASGGYQKPHRHPAAAALPKTLYSIDAHDYTNPAALPRGPVLVVGSGQTGCQLAEELYESGRDTCLSCGRAPWMPRRLDDRDYIAWALETPFFEATLADLPSPYARLGAIPQASGGRGGHDLHYRTLQKLGVTLLGRFVGCDGDVAHFAPDLAESVAFGDARYNELREMIAESCAGRGIKAPAMPSPAPFKADPSEQIDLRLFGAVLFTSGFRPDYASWVKFPAAFDDMGFPVQQDGSSTVIPGLHFMGGIFQRKRKSANFLGVAEDAAVLAKRILASPKALQDA